MSGPRHEVSRGAVRRSTFTAIRWAHGLNVLRETGGSIRRGAAPAMLSESLLPEGGVARCAGRQVACALRIALFRSPQWRRCFGYGIFRYELDVVFSRSPSHQIRVGGTGHAWVGRRARHKEESAGALGERGRQDPRVVPAP